MSRDEESTAAGGSRGVVRIEAAALREHGDKPRVDRVWERLEPKLTLGRKPRARAGRWPLVAAAVPLLTAVAAGFAMGITASGWLGGGDDGGAPVVMGPAGVERTPDIFAAGTTARSYPLPGGGTLTLQPGSIVDTVSRDGDALTLRLVRGDATFATANLGSIEMMVGGAHVSTAAGARMSVRRDGDHAFLEVFEGSARVTAPNADDEMVASRLGPNDVRRVRVNVTTAALPIEQRRSPSVPRVAHDDDDPDAVFEDAPAPLVPPAWEIACKVENDDAKTVQLLGQDLGAAASITDPAVLACVARGHLMAGSQDAAIASYEKLMSQPDTTRAMRAAEAVQRIYEKRRDAAKTEAERQLFAAKAQSFREQKHKLSLAALASGQKIEVFERAEALCNRIRAEAGISNWNAVTSLSAQYKGAYPNGPCTATIDGILAKQPALEPPAPNDGPADAGTPDDGPYADDGD